MSIQLGLRNRTVGTVKKSIAAICLAWFLRKVLHVWEGGFWCLHMYFATVESATSNPSSFSSDCILGAPQVGFSWDICLIRLRISLGILGRPILFVRDFQRQYNLKLCRFHLMTVSGLTIIKADFQSGHIRESQVQKTLSLLLSFGRLIVCCWTVSCWRGAKFSRISVLLLLNKMRKRSNIALKILILAKFSPLSCHLRWFNENWLFYVNPCK